MVFHQLRHARQKQRMSWQILIRLTQTNQTLTTFRERGHLTTTGALMALRRCFDTYLRQLPLANTLQTVLNKDWQAESQGIHSYLQTTGIAVPYVLSPLWQTNPIPPPIRSWKPRLPNTPDRREPLSIPSWKNRVGGKLAPADNKLDRIAAFSGPPRIWFYLMIAIRDTQLEISCLAIDKW